MLLVSMTGVKMADRLLQVGCEHGGRLGAVAAKVGLSGFAVAIVPDDASAARARKGASEAGVLVEIEVAPPVRLSAPDQTFDLVVFDDTRGLLGEMENLDRAASVREALRVLAPGGRVIVIGATSRGGLSSLVARAPRGVPFDPKPSLQAEGFRSARTLAEREGLSFVEAIKPRS